MDTVMLVLAIIVILLGIAGTVLPVLPGIPLIFITMAAYGWYEGFELITPKFLAIMGGLALLSLFIDYLATYLGAKRYGSSRKGMVGALLGAVAGLFILPPLGIFIGPWVGAVLGEKIEGKAWSESMQAGVGSLIGLFSGILFKLILAIVMFIAFLIAVF